MSQFPHLWNGDKNSTSLLKCQHSEWGMMENLWEAIEWISNNSQVMASCIINVRWASKMCNKHCQEYIIMGQCLWSSLSFIAQPYVIPGDKQTSQATRQVFKCWERSHTIGLHRWFYLRRYRSAWPESHRSSWEPSFYIWGSGFQRRKWVGSFTWLTRDEAGGMSLSPVPSLLQHQI